jgi:hypothetical protein
MRYGRFVADKPKLYIPPIRSRQELEALLASPDESVVHRALIDTAYHDPDCLWVQGVCLSRLGSPSVIVRQGALLGLQFLVAVRGENQPEVILEAVRPMLQDPSVALFAEGVINDICSRHPALWTQ